jgi:hypothetical protein
MQSRLHIRFERGVTGDQSENLNPDGGEISKGGDLCGGTGGVGEIVSVGKNSVTIKKKDGSTQKVNIADQADIKTSSGPATISDLKIGNRITIVGGPNPDGTFTADAVVVCAV